MDEDSIDKFEDVLREGIEEYQEYTSELQPDQLTQLLNVDSFWEAETRLLENFPSAVDTAGCISERTDLEAIALWKFPIVVRYIRDASMETIRDVSSRAFAEDDVTTRARVLTELPGVGPSMATTILMFSDPDSYTVMDPRATGALTEYDLWNGPTEASIPYYEKYLETCREISHETDYSLRDVDRGLFMLGGD